VGQKPKNLDSLQLQKDIEIAIQKCKEFDIVEMSFYKSAISSSNPIAEFILLYYILLHISGDTQSKVGKRIAEYYEINKIYLEICESRNSKGNIVKEDVFTNIRNRLSHRRDDINIDEILSLVLNHLPILRMIVKSEIGNKINFRFFG
jgi:hypothetical protein